MDQPATVECDVLVIGSGAGGLAAAITAAAHGSKAIVVEKSPVYGGTSALSGGYLWIPCNPLARDQGIPDSPEQALDYLRNQAGNFYDDATAKAFVKYGPEMVDFFQSRTEVRFSLNAAFPDYHSEAPGGVRGGRSIWAQPYRGNKLGKGIKKLRRPLREFSFLGMGIAKSDLRHFINARKSLKSAWFVTKLMTRLGVDLLLYGRSMRLVNGNALAARLGKTAQDLGVPIWLSAPAQELVREGSAVRGAVVLRDGRRVTIRARRGVVLASGGFPHDVGRRQKLYRHAAGERQQFSLASKDNSGDGLRLAEAAGAQVTDDLASSAYWMPVSEIVWPDGARGLVPHSGGVDRTMPGFICVLKNGRRFVNESTNYQDFSRTMQRACEGGEVSAFILCDHYALRRYGLGAAKPFPLPLRSYLRSGYLKRGKTIEDLAIQLGIDPKALAATVAEFNAHAREGEDPLFHRGVGTYDRYYSDPTGKFSPSLAPLEQPPFYGLKLLSGDVGTLAGLKTDGFARVLDAEGNPIAGLYAVGNDAANVFGGNVSGGGTTLGPGMTFGYIAGRHLASVM